jgi:hypothetical protein
MMEILPQKNIPFDVVKSFTKHTLYAAAPASSEEAMEFFHYITKKVSPQDSMVITIISTDGIFEMYLEKDRFFDQTKCHPFGYIRHGFTTGYQGTGPTTLVDALKTLTGNQLGERIQDVIF